ncbi:MAG: ArsR/SmtB family transcription factor [Bryobacteraceae bacterium]
MLDIIAEPSRQRILELVWEREVSAGEIAAQFPTSFGAVSQHLAILREAGLVSVRREGRHQFYRARQEQLGPLARYLETLWAGKLGRLKALAEFEEAPPKRRREQ